MAPMSGTNGTLLEGTLFSVQNDFRVSIPPREQIESPFRNNLRVEKAATVVPNRMKEDVCFSEAIPGQASDLLSLCW
jgi:hypothetical protein